MFDDKNLELTDEYWVNELRKRSHKAFEMIFKRYYADLFHFAATFVMDRETAEDIIQEVFGSLWSSCDSIPENTCLKKYLYSSVKHACLNYFKHLQVIDKHQERLTEALIFSGTLEYEDNQEILDRVRECFTRLPEQQRKVLEMKVFNDMSYREISAALSISEMTVHTHVKRAYKFIRESMPVLYWLLMYWGRF